MVNRYPDGMSIDYFDEHHEPDCDECGRRPSRCECNEPDFEQIIADRNDQ